MKNATVKIPLIMLLLLSLVLMEGCWDLKDIDKKLIVTALGFDLQDDDIWCYMEIANTEAPGGSERQAAEGAPDKFMTVTTHGRSLPEVRGKFEEKLDKPMYLSGVRTLIFTERFADRYMMEYLYRFRADETYRKKTICAITRDDLGELFNKTHERQESLGISVEGLFETLDELGRFFPRTTGRIIENLSDDYSGFLLPCIELDTDRPAIVGYSVVKNQDIVGFIPITDARIRGVYFLKVKKAKNVYIVPYKNNQYTIQTVMEKRRTKPSYDGRTISIRFAFTISADVMYGSEKTPYNLTESEFTQLSFALSDLIKSDINGAISQAKTEFNCDYLQFDDKFRINYPQTFDTMDWNDQFPRIETAVEVKVHTHAQPGLDYSSSTLK